MPKFTVRFTRVEYQSCTKEFEAATREEAEELAGEAEIADEEWEVTNADESHHVE